MKIAFLGASGLIGSGVYEQIEKDHDITKLGRRQVSDVRIDLLKPEHITPSIFEGCDTLIHCAGVIDEDYTSSARDAYLKGTFSSKKIVESAYTAGVLNYVYISTAHIYGNLEGKITEETPVNPLSDYAITHYATEQVFRRLGHQHPGKTKTLILRPCSVYGIPNSFEHFKRWSLVPFNFAKQAVEKRSIELLPNSNQVVRNFISSRSIGLHVKNFLIDQNLSGFTVKNPIGTYNASIYDFAKLCASVYESMTGVSCPVNMLESESFCNQKKLNYTSLYTEQPQDQKVGEYLSQIIGLNPIKLMGHD